MEKDDIIVQFTFGMISSREFVLRMNDERFRERAERLKVVDELLRSIYSEKICGKLSEGIWRPLANDLWDLCD